MSGKFHFQNEAYKKKVAAVEEFVKENFQTDLANFIRSRGWKEDADLCVNIVSDNLTADDVSYIQEKLGRLRHLRNSRSPLEYALDLMLGWAIEDGILEVLLSQEFSCQLSSADREREFLTRPKASSDITVDVAPGKKVLLEVVKDFEGYWAKNKKIDLRDAKYNRLKKEKGILLGLDFNNKKFFVLPTEKAKATYISSHAPYGGKPAYSISLKEVEFHDLKELKEVLRELR